NDEIPVSGREYLRWLDDLFVMHGVAMYEGNPQWRWDEKKKQFISDQVSDEMKNAVAFIRSLYAKGYMDKTMPILKGADWLAKIEKNTVGHYFHTTSGMERRVTALRSAVSGATPLAPDAEFVYMPNVQVGNLPHQKNYAGGLTPDIAITVKAKDPAKILQWYDWIWSQEGTIYKFFGIEGLNYKREGSKIVVDKTVTSLSNKFPFVMRSGNRTAEMYSWMPAGDQMAAVYKASINDAQFVQNTFMPVKVYDGFEDYIPSKAPLYQERVAKIIIGELPMEAWDAYVKEWNDKGGKVVTERATQWYKDVHGIK
ncbi:MAG: hypothetical protein Q8M76_04470, partial [Spirochaetaceae bacterium]|nr:hypothetical protein [Spirochaetaceae bacterium]